MRGRKVSLIAAVVVCLGLGSAVPAGAQEVIETHDLAAEEGRFVELINAERVKAGLGLLVSVPELVNVGRDWSRSMVVVSAGSEPCVISHNPSLASKVTLNWRRLGENVGCGNVDVDFLHQKFVNSPPHYRNIMDPSFDSVGIGIMYEGDVMFVTQQFMDLRDATPTSAAPSALTLTQAKVPAKRIVKIVKKRK